MAIYWVIYIFFWIYNPNTVSRPISSSKILPNNHL